MLDQETRRLMGQLLYRQDVREALRAQYLTHLVRPVNSPLGADVGFYDELRNPNPLLIWERAYTGVVAQRPGESYADMIVRCRRSIHCLQGVFVPSSEARVAVVTPQKPPEPILFKLAMAGCGTLVTSEGRSELVLAVPRGTRIVSLETTR